MFKQNKSQLTIGEHLIYQNLSEDILSRTNKLIDWKPFEKNPLLPSSRPCRPQSLQPRHDAQDPYHPANLRPLRPRNGNHAQR